MADAREPAPGVTRLAEPSDARSILAIYTPIVTETIISFETEPPSLSEMRARIARGGERWPWLVHEESGEVVGFACSSPHRTRAAYRWSVDVSVYVRDDARRRGVATALYAELLASLKRKGYCNAYAGIALPNPASVALHESLGFKSVGVYRGVGFKLGAWRDVGWWGLRLQDDPSALDDARQPASRITR